MKPQSDTSSPFCLYRLYVRALDSVQSVLLLLVRLVWGIGFMETGWGKWHSIPKVIGFFTQIGIPFPAMNAYIVASLELGGGLLLALGLASRLIPVPLIFSMIVAYVTTEQDALHSILKGSLDPFLSADPFLFLFAALIILIFGPGKFSLDYLISRKAGSTGE